MIRIGLVLALAGLMVVVDTTVTVVAVPAMVAGLDSSLAAVQWVTTGYLLGIVGVIPVAGWAANRFGARRVYLFALGAFTVFSALAGLAWNAASLAVFRVLQGLGGGLLNPIGQAIGLRTVPRDRRGHLMSLLGLPLIVGPVLGPPLAGWLVDEASWRWIFLVNIPVGALAVLLVLRHLPPDAPSRPRAPVPAAATPRPHPPSAAGSRPSSAVAGAGGARRPRPSSAAGSRPSSAVAGAGGARRPHPSLTEAGVGGPAGRPEQFDWGGLVLLSSGSVLLVLGATLVGEGGTPGWAAALVGATGTLLVGAFVRRAGRLPAPLVELRLLRRRTFAAGTTVLAAFGAGYFGAFAVLPLFVQGVRGDPATVAGTIAIPQAIAVGVTVQVATRLVDRVPPRRIALAGTSTGLLGCLVLLGTATADAPYAAIVAGAVLLGVGAGATLLPTMTVALRDLEGPDTPRGTTLLALVQQLAAAIGVAVVAAALTGLLAGPTGGGGVAAMLALDPAARPAERPGLAGAVGAAYGVSVVLTAVSVVAAAVGLRRRPAPG